MMTRTTSRFFLVLGLGLVAASGSLDAHAQTKGKAASSGAEAPAATKSISHELTGISWGQTIAQVTEAVGRILDEDYKPLYQKTSPGVKMKQLDAALAEEKAAFARSRIDYGRVPPVLDLGPLKGEYTYNNAESKLQLTRKGVTFHFFFIQDAMWKLIAERRLGENEPAGTTFSDAGAKVSADLGVAGRVLAANAAIGQPFPEVDWKDTRTHLRLINRGGAMVAFGYEDQATLGRLAILRSNKPAEPAR